MRAIATSGESVFVIAKKQVCMIVLMRPFRPASRAMRNASTTKNRSFLATISSCSSSGSSSQTASGP